MTFSLSVDDAGTKAGEWIQWLTYIPCVAVLKVIYSPYVNKAFVYIFVSKILSFIRQLFIFSSF